MLHVVLLAATFLAGSPDSLTIRFIANEAVSLSDGRLTLVLDFPYQSGYSNYMTYPDAELTLEGDVVAVITHRHRDHFAAERFIPTGWRILGPREVTRTLPPERVVPLDTLVRIGGAIIRPIRTPHSDTEHYSYLIEWQGRGFFFVGDTDDPATLLGAKALDLAFVSPWLLSAARRGGREVAARQVVVYHHMTAESVPCERCIVPKQGQVFGLPVP